MPGAAFDPWKTYHESPAEQAAIKARAKYRDAMKEEYRRITSNPFKPPMGVIHDPNMQRWFSARVTYAEYLKPSTRGVLVTSVIFGATALIYYALALRRNKLLAEVTNGQVDYRTRALTYDPK
ncbi:unnamed protein product [Taenia asiatica]|uniref:NADH dehydrogenase [ubiquinone] 1 beta subcomplex subunit 4 n=1 Tax=Taenia asiatica TaxID=60517 RepID=A0A0R3W5K0_TAEAS|nr:unnamed protein product [Taenia asiatica]